MFFASELFICEGTKRENNDKSKINNDTEGDLL